MSQIAIVDYGMGNLRSVYQALRHVAPDSSHVEITSDPDTVLNADQVVFPGQGAARDCMRALRQHQLEEVVLKAANSKPFLGICMGMQVLMESSEENGGVDCLGKYSGQVRRFSTNTSAAGERLKFPQMGWNRIAQKQDHPLWQGIEDNSRFYFVHSYFVAPDDSELVSGETDYGLNYASAIAKDNVFAIQAHPEKSADDGLQLLKNFTRWKGQ